MPAIAKVNEGFRNAGEALWPQRFPLRVLERIREEVGGYVWAALYDQMPSAAEGTIFKRQWFRYFSDQPRFSRIVQSWDTSFKTGTENDFSACTTWGVAENGYHLLWFWKGKAEFPELKRKMQLWQKPGIRARFSLKTRRADNLCFKKCGFERHFQFFRLKLIRTKLPERRLSRHFSRQGACSYRNRRRG
jgi:hypothetical protein